MSEGYEYIDLEETYDDMIWFRLSRGDSVAFRFATLARITDRVFGPRGYTFQGWHVRSANNGDRHEIRRYVLNKTYSNGIARDDGMVTVLMPYAPDK